MIFKNHLVGYLYSTYNSAQTFVISLISYYKHIHLDLTHKEYIPHFSLSLPPRFLSFFGPFFLSPLPFPLKIPLILLLIKLLLMALFASGILLPERSQKQCTYHYFTLLKLSIVFLLGPTKPSIYWNHFLKSSASCAFM